ncbi:Hypothetical predicted protein [Podarcis lilfordi]|uniref:Uncharacterized protein n=1 Tax=Podarcis lilfordi TaxID=74358 RepID=A0AA35JQI9_9SAUR|nr:Hypothetical predicted protein [Podarcis lilfordi]
MESNVTAVLQNNASWIHVASLIACCAQVPLVLLDSVLLSVSIFQLIMSAEIGVAPVTSLSTAMELQSGVLKMFMYKMAPRVVMVYTANMEIAQLTVGSVK